MPTRQRPHRHHRETLTHLAGCLSTQFARYTVVLALLLLPLFWGGNHPYSMGYALLLGLLGGGLWLLGSTLRLRFKICTPRGLLFFVPAVLILLLQLSPSVFSLFSTSALLNLWELSSEFLSTKPVLAIVPNQQLTFIVQILIVALFYCLICQLFRGTDRIFQLVLAILAATTLSALLGLAEYFGHIDWLIYVDGKGTSVARGGYLNRNHFAQLCAMGYFCGIGIFIALLSAKTGSALATRFQAKAKVVLLTAVGIATTACGLAVIFSYSRTAILTTGFGTALLAAMLAATRIKRYLSIPVLTAILALSVGALYGLDLVISRIEFALSGNDPSGLARLEIWSIVWDAIRMSPILGAGASAVQALTPLFDTSFMPGKIAFDAHNDYLELMAVFGIPFTLAVIAGILFASYRTIQCLWAHRHTDSSFLPIALAISIGLVGALIHECTDYGFKHIANLVVFAALSVALVEFLRHFESQSIHRMEDLPIQRISLSKTQAALTFGIGLLVLLSCIPYALSQIRLGETLLHLQNLITAPAIRANMKPLERLEAIRAVASDALRIDPASQTAAYAKIQASLNLVEEQESTLVATALSKRFDRTISAERARSKTYQPYWLESIRTIPGHEKQSVIATLQSIEHDALSLAGQTPSNAIALSIAAMARDHLAAFTSSPMTSQALHQKALSLYPWHTDILKRALRAATISSTRQNLDDETLATYAKRLCKQAPQELSWVLPILWSAKESPELLASVSPKTIAAQERLARFLLEQQRSEEALSALEQMDRLNNDRPDVETPDSMGILPYLSREIRDKATVSRDIERLRVLAFTIADRPVDRVASEEKLTRLEGGLRLPFYEQIDRWMATGQWILAQKAMTRLPKTADRLIREAEIAYAMGSFRQARRLLGQLTWLEEEPSQNLKQRARHLQYQLPAESTSRNEAASEQAVPIKDTTP